MSTASPPKNPIENWEAVRDEWLDRLAALLDSVETWARELDWSTRRIDKRMEDTRIGDYRAPVLILQGGTTRAMLEPIARFSAGTEGLADFYLMPAYDDIARLYYKDGSWWVYHVDSMDKPAREGHRPNYEPLTRETFRGVLESMARDGG